MNWYKKSQLTETLPYFQEFEDMGDYVPDVDQVHQVLREKYNTKIIRDIGHGDSGVAYELDNGDVLKITTNAQEAKVAEWLLSNPNPNIASYKATWRTGDLFYIIMERIEPLPDELKEKIAQILADVESNRESSYISTRVPDVIRFLKQKYRERYINNILPHFISYLEHIQQISFIPIFDFLNLSNIGVKNGKLKFFDIT